MAEGIKIVEWTLEGSDKNCFIFYVEGLESSKYYRILCQGLTLGGLYTPTTIFQSNESGCIKTIFYRPDPEMIPPKKIKFALAEIPDNISIVSFKFVNLGAGPTLLKSPVMLPPGEITSYKLSFEFNDPTEAMYIEGQTVKFTPYRKCSFKIYVQDMNLVTHELNTKPFDLTVTFLYEKFTPRSNWGPKINPRRIVKYDRSKTVQVEILQGFEPNCFYNICNTFASASRKWYKSDEKGRIIVHFSNMRIDEEEISFSKLAKEPEQLSVYSFGIPINKISNDAMMRTNSISDLPIGYVHAEDIYIEKGVSINQTLSHMDGERYCYSLLIRFPESLTIPEREMVVKIYAIGELAVE